MELLTPGFGLIFWQLLAITSVVVLITAWIIIVIDKSIEPGKKSGWMFFTLLLPLVGPLYFFISYRRARKVNMN